MKIAFTVLEGGVQREVTVEPIGNGTHRVSFDGHSILIDARRVNDREYHFLVGDRSHNLLLGGSVPKLEAFLDGKRIHVEFLDESQVSRRTRSTTAAGADGTLAVRAPMPGRVVKCLVSLGEEVASGQGIVVVEAMKMENELRSPRKGIVKAIKVTEGQNVEMGVELVLIE